MRIGVRLGPVRLSTSTRKGRRRRPRQPSWHGTGHATTPDGREVDFRCPHNHRTQSAALDCSSTVSKQIGRGQNLHLITHVRSTPASREAARQRALQQETRRQAKEGQRAQATHRRVQQKEALAQPFDHHSAWTSYPTPGQESYLPPSYQTQNPPVVARPRRRRLRKRNAILLIIAALFIIGAISDALGSTSKPQKPTATGSGAGAAVAGQLAHSTGPTSSAKANPIRAAETACDKRSDASGDIYVRMVQPGQSPVAQELRGNWIWDSALRKCLTSVQMTIATAPRSSGTCTQVGYVADNPGYDPNAAVAAPLTRVVAQAGPACSRPAAPPAPATSPAPQPTPTASAAPTGCHPLSDEGTCYEPGEYCRTADHGASGIAGDGEAITCEDNDGWRWEPS
jgi:hypothetical protein